MIYKGAWIISAIRSLRKITGHTLCDCRSILKNPDGFILTEEASNTLLKDYLTNNPGVGYLPNYLDWIIIKYNNTQPMDLRAYEFSPLM